MLRSLAQPAEEKGPGGTASLQLHLRPCVERTPFADASHPCSKHGLSARRLAEGSLTAVVRDPERIWMGEGEMGTCLVQPHDFCVCKQARPVCSFIGATQPVINTARVPFDDEIQNDLSIKRASRTFTLNYGARITPIPRLL